jgi:aldehyde dehydrogenase (NAD+)
MAIMRDEIFGPILCIMPFDTEEEAIAIANDTPYGLTNYVQTGSTKRRRRLARALQAGMVEINGVSFDYGAPFGGIKASGNGREGGVYGLEEFCEIKAVSGY